jgi:hypothetical protein
MKWIARVLILTSAFSFGIFSASLLRYESRPSVAPVNPPSATIPIRAESLLGTWQGKWGHNNGDCTIVITRVEGNAFYGTLNKEGAAILFEGKFDPNTRMFYFDETKVEMLGAEMSAWSLGSNTGVISTDGHVLVGLGRDEWGAYSWSASND